MRVRILCRSSVFVHFLTIVLISTLEALISVTSIFISNSIFQTSEHCAKLSFISSIINITEGVQALRVLELLSMGLIVLERILFLV